MSFKKKEFLQFLSSGLNTSWRSWLILCIFLAVWKCWHSSKQNMFNGNSGDHFARKHNHELFWCADSKLCQYDGIFSVQSSVYVHVFINGYLWLTKFVCNWGGPSSNFSARVPGFPYFGIRCDILLDKLCVIGCGSLLFQFIFLLIIFLLFNAVEFPSPIWSARPFLVSENLFLETDCKFQLPLDGKQ